MQAAEALYYVALRINSSGDKYVKRDNDGLYRPSNKRDRNSLLSLINEADLKDPVNQVALQAITAYISASHRRNPLFNHLLEKFYQINPPYAHKTHEIALLYFMNNFHVYLNRKARAIIKKDIELLTVISEVYWKYSNGDKENYYRWMTEFFVGTHKLIRDDHREIKARLEGIARSSSHYNSEEQQSHIMGSLIPEALFHEGDFAYDKKTEKILGGKYWDQLSDAEKAGKEKIHCFWIQTENTPDGPGWFDFIYHRTLDFVRYIFYKHVAKSDRPQIGPYKKANGERGLPDHSPLFIQPQIEANRAYDTFLLRP